MLWAIGAIAGGALNAFSQASERRAVNTRLDGFMEELRGHMLDENEIQGKVRRTNGVFNSSLNNLLSRTAFNSRGVVNAPVAKAAVSSTLEGNRLAAISNVYDQAQSFNLGIQDKIGQLGMAKQEGSGLGDFFSGAVQGGIAGAQIDALTPKTAELNYTPPKPPGQDSLDGFGFNLNSWRGDSMMFNTFPKMNLPGIN